MIQWRAFPSKKECLYILEIIQLRVWQISPVKDVEHWQKCVVLSFFKMQVPLLRHGEDEQLL